jgi:serine/threonine protein kinase
LLLQLYQKILQQENVIADNSSELRTLLNLGLVEDQGGQLKVANRIYAHIFDPEWVEQELAQAKERRIIRRRYEILEEIGDGDLIRTYLVKDRDLRSPIQYVVKQLIPASTDIDTLGKIRNLFNSELKELEKLNGHGQIPKLLASFEEDQKFYTVQEFIEGHNLDEDIKVNEQWRESSVINLLIDILEILEFVHRQELSHLNLKPANLRRRKQDGKIVLIDFGTLKQISALTSSGQTASAEQVGTPGYIPSVEIGDRTEVSRDIYAVGITGIQALTGIRPIELAKDPKTGEIIWRFVTPGRQMVQVSDALARILEKMVRHSADDRYTTVSEALDDLRALERRPASPQSMPRLVDQRLLIGGLAGLLILGGLGYWQYQRSIKARQVAQCNQPTTFNESNVGLVQDANDVKAACTQVIDRQSNNYSALKNRGKAFLLLWKQESENPDVFLNQAFEDFQKASQLQQQDPQTFFYLGLTQQVQNKPDYKDSYQKAIDLYLQREASEIPATDFPILAELGSFLLQGNSYSRVSFQNADAIFQKAREVNPESVSMIYNLGSLNAMSGNYQDAIDAFDQVIERDVQKQNYRGWISRGFASLLLGKKGFKDAQTSFQQALSVKPDYALARDYNNRIEACLQPASNSENGTNSTLTNQPSCTLENLTTDKLQADFKTIFPIAPVYKCADYPVLTVSKQESVKPLCQ